MFGACPLNEVVPPSYGGHCGSASGAQRFNCRADACRFPPRAEPHGAFDGGARVSSPARRWFLGPEAGRGLIVVPLWKSVPMEALRVQRAGYGGHACLLTRTEPPVGGASRTRTFDDGAGPVAPLFFAARRLVLRAGIGVGLNCRTPLEECSYGSS